jgi:hypothetical protein
MVVAALWGGAIADPVDRRRMLLFPQIAHLRFGGPGASKTGSLADGRL